MTNGDSMDWDDDTFTNRPSPRYITLTMRQGPNPGHRFTVRKSSVTIGRLPANDVAISDQQVSRHHASISWDNDQYIIRDLGSANGTAVNGTVLTGPCPLRDGDVINLGEIVLTFQGSSEIPGLDAAPYSRMKGAPLGAPLVTPRASSAQPLSGTMEMDGYTDRGGRSTMWPILIGIAMALFLALVFVAVVLLVVLSQSSSTPELAVQQPLNGSESALGNPVLILASATDRKGVTRVEIWVDGDLLANITSNQPGGQNILMVQHPWVPSGNGTHHLTLKAFNAAGQSSKPVDLEVTVTGQQQITPKVSPSPTPASTVTPLVLLTATPTEIPLVPPTATAMSCANEASFVADVTVPDNTVFQPGARIDKTWRIRNNGTCSWGTGYRLVFVSGNKMGAPDNQPVVPTAPGGTTDVTVTMYAPTNYGTHTGVWRMVDTTGESFGQQFTIVIQVPSPYTPTPAVTPTNTPLPGPAVSISVDRDHINAGECTTVHASVEGVRAAWLNGEGIGGGHMDKQVCPCDDTKYSVDAELASGEHIVKDLTVYVEGSCTVDKPDLVIRDLLETDGNTEPSVNETIHIRLRIKNEGSETARDVRVIWRPYGESSSEDIKEDRVDRLDPGKDHNFYWDFEYDRDGEFKTFAKVDYTNDVDESEEDNNTKTLRIRVRD